MFSMFDINFDSVTKTYQGSRSPAVDDVSFSIKKGQLVSVLGPSGCGKTTILRLIAGFERQERGEIHLAGKKVSSTGHWVPPEKRNTGMVFQDYALFPHLNVSQNIGFGYKGRDRARRIDEVIELVRLKGYQKRYPHQLSGGQQQRIALGRALARRPVVVLLDEPFSNLDTSMKVAMRDEVREIIKKAGATAVLVTHDQKDALALSDEIIVLKEGRIQQCGEPRKIYQYPQNKFVADFVGHSNVLAARIGKDRKTVITSLGSIPCSHTHGLCPGTAVYVSVRPESFELDQKGEIEGVVNKITYTGQTIDAAIDAAYNGGKKTGLLVHIHPEKEIGIGQKVRFKVLPDFTAVIKDRP